MPIGLIGKKMGMTRVFTEAGASVPVTVVHAPANCVTQVKTPDRDGYLALQMAAGECRSSRVRKPMTGHFKKAGVGTMRSTHEFRIAEEESRRLGDQVKVSSFTAGEKVNVVGVSKGKGFAGVVKRHHFKTQDATHGNSLSHRTGGSIGQCQTPGRVFKGKKMAGQMGNKRVTARNLTVVKVDAERELLLLEGAVPGARGGEVWIHHLAPVPPTEETPAAEEAPQEQAPASEEQADAGKEKKAAAEKTEAAAGDDAASQTDDDQSDAAGDGEAQ